jgi:hypothetical protein
MLDNTSKHVANLVHDTSEMEANTDFGAEKLGPLQSPGVLRTSPVGMRGRYSIPQRQKTH